MSILTIIPATLNIPDAIDYCADLLPDCIVLAAIHAVDNGYPIIDVRFRLPNEISVHTGKPIEATLTVWAEPNGDLYGEW